MYKYFTAKNTYRFLDVLPKFVAEYNDSVHRSIDMSPSQVTESDVLAIWKRLNGKSKRIRKVMPKLQVGQHVRISKEEMRFAKGAEQNYTTEMFKINKVIRREPPPRL
jgi:transcription initiation factor IIE alpha subunit